MVESLVITLREGIEAALVVGIILAYLKKTGRTSYNRQVYLGLGLAVLASIAFAAVFNILQIDPENEYLEGALMGVAAIFVVSMVIWMWRTARNIKGEIEERLSSIVQKSEVGAGGLGFMVFTFFMVFREGIETVLFLVAATLQEASILSVVGGALGLALAVAFAVLLFRGSIRINLGRFFTLTSIILLLLALKLLAGSLHEFAEVQLIPMTKEIMAFLGYLVRDDTSMVLMMALLALPLIMVLWDTGGRREAASGEATERRAERRKQMAASNRERIWRVGLVTATLFILFAMGSTVLAGSKFNDPSPVPVSSTNGELKVALAELEEGHLSKFSFDLGGPLVNFLAVKLDDGSVATALDACQICGSIGYMQEGKDAICKNCNAPIPMETMGMGGGCNPIELPAKLQRDDLVVKVADLRQAWEGTKK